MLRLLLILIFSSFLPVHAQDEKRFISKQIWLDYNPSVAISNKLSMYGDIGARTVFPNDWYRYNFRIGANFRPFVLSEKHALIKNIQFHGGLGDFYTQSLEGNSINEFRLYQGVRAYWPNRKRVRVSHFLRFEERFEELFNSQSISFSTRMRYQLMAKIKFQKEFLQDVYLPLSVEFFMSLGQGLYFNDVMRLTPGIGYNFSDQFRTEFHVSYHNSRNSPTESFENNDLVFRLRVFHIF